MEKQLIDHIQKEYYISKVCTVCSAIMYFILCGIMFMAENKVVSDSIVIVASLLFYLLPLVLLVSWQMCGTLYPSEFDTL